jgi:hypothetical protein
MASLAASKSSVVARAVAGRTVRVAPRVAVSSSRRTAVEVRASTGAPLVGSKAPDFKAQVMMMEGVRWNTGLMLMPSLLCAGRCSQT